jgi:quercetin dioxygenase-like cupin family protein
MTKRSMRTTVLRGTRTTVLRRASMAAVCTAAALVLSGAAPGAAALSGAAEPPVTSDTLSEGDTSQPFAIKAEDKRHFMNRKITVQPGATGGWHTHAGEQVAVIKSGELTRYDKECKPHVYRSGDALVEPADPKDVHIGINTGDDPLVLYVVDMLPEGAPVAVPAENPGCPDLPE